MLHIFPDLYHLKIPLKNAFYHDKYHLQIERNQHFSPENVCIICRNPAVEKYVSGLTFLTPIKSQKIATRDKKGKIGTLFFL
jgi:hypothetical protein